MPKSAFRRKFRQDIKRVNNSLGAYIDDPEDEKNIHDIRVSIRRLDATFSLLPRKARSRYSGRIEKYKDLLRANSNARDCDIIAGRLAALGAPITADVQEKKKAELARAIRLARPLKKLPARLASAPDYKRVDKIAGRLVGRIKETLPLVLSDSTKVNELHRIRRDLRKLRHILDVARAGSRKIFMKKLARADGTHLTLEELQDLLGSIHDCDITIEYLKGRPDLGQHLDREIGNRRRLYQKFVRQIKK